MTSQGDEYAFLWDGSEEGWTVVRTRVGPGAIYNTTTHRVLVIENDHAAERTIRLMSENGCPVLGSLPQAPPPTDHT
ncbi:hypothetical protein ACFVG1_02640 [Streptomyces bacillaris]|uniref:Uncharacterized protein n=2 Tax=Streptomyces TaxID=1883 RepID=A0A1E7LR14_9ACTN|nr:hypothetical protein [Streptomyces nanshensis]OEV18611.1 hypothetical protein AN221_21310 [Streptomyces nanshensis]QCW79426.1 hypothetical protein EQG64_25145 [Streptomyces sp. S6]